jgi:hypothetical protein
MSRRRIASGVLVGGWLLVAAVAYADTIPTSIAVPRLGDAGVAEPYPSSLIVRAPGGPNEAGLVNITLHAVTHPCPEDLAVLLVHDSTGHPTEKFLLMANAGGCRPLQGTDITFTRGAAPIPDTDANPVPYGPQLVTGVADYGVEPVFLAPVPTGPNVHGMPPATTIIGGTWSLYVIDTQGGHRGVIAGGWSLQYANSEPASTLSIVSPAANPSAATTPFVHIEGQIAPFLLQQQQVTWRTVANGAFYDAGEMTIVPGTGIVTAEVPLKKGANVITLTLSTTSGPISNTSLTVNVDEFTYSLSEGATGGFFDLDVTIGNPTGVAAPVRIDFLPEHAAVVPYPTSVAANAPLQLRVNNIVDGDGVSTIVHSTDGVPLAVERTMSWDKTGYGGHGGSAISPNRRWLFAEGSQGYFDTFVLLANDNASDAHVTAKFLVEGGSPVTYPVTVPAHKRVTIYAGDIPAIVNTSFGIDVSADVPITAERSMYFPHGGPRIFEGGHESAGANATSTGWILAEGATGPFFECYILLSNPGGTDAHVRLNYMLPRDDSDQLVAQDVTVPANSRTTIDVETVSPLLANTPVSTLVSSDVGIIVERSMYWPDISIGWREAHNSVAVTTPSLRWGVSDGRIGGARDYQTYMLLANPNPWFAEVQVRFLKPGAAPVVKSYTLNPASRFTIWSGDMVAELGEGVFSADVQVLNFQPIVVEKAMYWNSGDEVWAAGTGVVATPLPPP